MSEAIENNLAGPQRVRVDRITVEQHELDKAIAADEYLAEKEAANKRTLPVRFAKIRPGSAPG